MKNFWKINKIQFRKKMGFTLIETLISITILTTSIAAPLVLAGKSLKTVNLIEEKTIAFYLAQDAFEYVINKKITNKLNFIDFLDGLSECQTHQRALNGCFIDVINNIITPCLRLECSRGVLYKGTSGDYDHSNDPDDIRTLFTRSIKIKTITENINGTILEAEVEVKVKWKNSGKDQESVLKSHITNW